MMYPVTLTPSSESSQVMARFPDVPEAITVGKDREEAVGWAEDALVVALHGYMEDGKDIPPPSRVAPGQPFVVLPVLVGAKLAVYQAMREKGITRLALAEKLGIDPRQVRRILDLDHKSRIELVEAALKALGKILVLEVRQAA